MKKIFLSAVVVCSALVFSGCGSQKETQTPVQPVEKSAPTENGGVVNSIKEAIGLGSKMKCTSTSKDGEVSVAYVQGKKFKAVSDVEKKKENVIFDGETTYFWVEGETKGFKMATSCLESLKTNLPEQQQNLITDAVPNIEEEIENSDEKSSCVPAGDVDFNIPSNVVFEDQCEIMKKTFESLSNVSLPAGAGLPGNLPAIPN